MILKPTSGPVRPFVISTLKRHNIDAETVMNRISRLKKRNLRQQQCPKGKKRETVENYALSAPRSQQIQIIPLFPIHITSEGIMKQNNFSATGRIVFLIMVAAIITIYNKMQAGAEFDIVSPGFAFIKVLTLLITYCCLYHLVPRTASRKYVSVTFAICIEEPRLTRGHRPFSL